MIANVSKRQVEDLRLFIYVCNMVLFIYHAVVVIFEMR
jgi:hypothetical protein